MGQYARAFTSLGSLGVVEQNDDTYKKLLNKHPQEESTKEFTHTAPSQPITFSIAQVQKGIKSFKRGSAPGLDGMRAEHLIVIASHLNGRDTNTLSSITNLVNHMVVGKVPDRFRPYMAGSRLFRVIKKDGSLRPIVVGNIFRRLTSKVMASVVAPKTKDIFYPSQLGVGHRNGCESIIHSMVRGLQDNPDKYLLQVDLVNAYRQADRVEMFKQVEKHLPECLDWVLSCYEVPSNMYFSDRVIHSAQGCQQGDPFSSVSFALNLQMIIDWINEEVLT